MPKPRERDIEGAVVRWAKEHGWLTCKIVAQRGWPDRVFVAPKNNRVVFIEFKRPSGRLTKLQARRNKELYARGCEVYVVYSVADGIVMLEEGWGREVYPS